MKPVPVTQTLVTNLNVSHYGNNRRQASSEIGFWHIKSKMVKLILVTEAFSPQHFKNYKAHFPLLKDIKKEVSSVR